MPRKRPPRRGRSLSAPSLRLLQADPQAGEVPLGETQPVAGPAVGRNDPCPCGSGKKYKHCHLAHPDYRREERWREQALGIPPVHDRDERLKHAMLEWAYHRFGNDSLAGGDDFQDADAAAPLAIPWCLFHAPVEGRPVAEWYVEERGDGLSEDDLAWLRAQHAASLSVREVLSVVEGAMVVVRDLLNGDEESVAEGTASRTLVQRDAVLARIAKFQDESYFVGVHPRALGPLDAAEVVRRVRARFRLGPHAPLDRLRDPAVGRHLIACWEEAAEAADRRSAKLPELRNTDGDEMVLTTDHFAFDAPHRDEVAAQVAAMEGAHPPEAEEREPAYTFVREGDAPAGMTGQTILGTARLGRDRLDVETNSTRRADGLRERIEAACGELLRYRAREHSDPFALVRDRAQAGSSRRPGRGVSPGRRGIKGAPPLEAATPEMAAALLEFKQRYYTDWLDQPIPMLGGKTPRQAVRTARGREQVDALLKTIENGEARLAPGARLDLRPMRRELGLEG